MSRSIQTPDHDQSAAPRRRGDVGETASDAVLDAGDVQADPANDEAPVLLRLPDLTRTSAPMAPAGPTPQSVVETAEPVTVACAVEPDVMVAQAVEPENGNGPMAASDETSASDEVRERRRRRREQHSESSSWNTTSGRVTIGGAIVVVTLLLAAFLVRNGEDDESNQVWGESAAETDSATAARKSDDTNTVPHVASAEADWSQSAPSTLPVSDGAVAASFENAAPGLPANATSEAAVQSSYSSPPLESGGAAIPENAPYVVSEDNSQTTPTGSPGTFIPTPKEPAPPYVADGSSQQPYQDPGYQQPYQNSTYQDPGYQQPYQDSGYQQPYQDPGYQQPYQDSTYQDPGYQQPYQDPGYQQPSYRTSANEPSPYYSGEQITNPYTTPYSGQ